MARVVSACVFCNAAGNNDADNIAVNDIAAHNAEKHSARKELDNTVEERADTPVTDARRIPAVLLCPGSLCYTVLQVVATARCTLQIMPTQ
jgi:hypothetical protein